MASFAILNIFHKIHTVDFKKNNSFSFFRTNNSFHGVEQIIDKSTERKLIQYSIMAKNNKNEIS